MAAAFLASQAHAGADSVVNGSFESPSLVGIASDYLHTPGGNSVEGSWWNNPWDAGGPWLLRGGLSLRGSYAGVFATYGDLGSAGSLIGFRVVQNRL